MLRIAKEEKERFEALKKSCDTCIPDELIEWINQIIEKLENKDKIIEALELLYRKNGLPCQHDTFNANTCSECEYGKESRCKEYLAYREILELL